MPEADGKADTLSMMTKGAVAGAIGAAAMAMYAMAAGATYLSSGFFTPMYHIASSLISPKSMMSSMMAAENGDMFFFSLGPALAGMAIHMMTGATFGAIFGLLLAKVALSPSTALVAGVSYGILVMLINSFVALPLIAALFGGGEAISQMPSMVGWLTFTIEHLLYGMVLGIWAALALRKTAFAPRTAYSGT